MAVEDRGEGRQIPVPPDEVSAQDDEELAQDLAVRLDALNAAIRALRARVQASTSERSVDEGKEANHA